MNGEAGEWKEKWGDFRWVVIGDVAGFPAGFDLYEIIANHP
jgi:hypothetical protein